MKFAKELDRDLIPEWRSRYLNYKLGKKKLKAIHRALRNVNSTPRLRRRGANSYTPSPDNAAPQYAFVNRDNGSGDLHALGMDDSVGSLQSKANRSRSTLSREYRRTPEEQPLNVGQEQRKPGTTYGSIERSASSERRNAPPSLKLPGAALDTASQASPLPGPSAPHAASVRQGKTVQLPESAADPSEPNNAKTVHYNASSLPFRYKSVFSPKRVNSTPADVVTDAPRPLLRRVFSMSHKARPLSSPGDTPLEAYRELDLRQAEFFQFLDMELEKIEKFYRQKEDEATERLSVLREQLHIMRDRRLDELISQQAAKIKAKEKKKSAAHEALMNGRPSSSEEDVKTKTKGNSQNPFWMNPIDSAMDAMKAGRGGKTTKAIADLATALPQEGVDARRDFSRRPDLPDVSYQTARRKLKTALQEYYRGLELLKSYALLNRTAFRKINKKYDKTVNARPTMRYMAEKVNTAWFVQSDVVEGHIRTVEDLYARYFEKGNHKVAIGKLRIKMARAGDYTENSFRNGVTLAAGLVLILQGLVYAAEMLHTDDPVLNVNTSYLLQIYAGYFLMNFLFLLFCVACRVWHQAKINYVFVFEYDTRHHLDWRQLCELPCFYFFLLGLFMWLNFCRFGGDGMYHYYPVILLSLTAVILVLPLPILYWRSRHWLLYSMWRLCLAGLYPVEFRDFYLGDMFCSLTYAMGNIALFFCLYANEWDSPPMCNSSHSRLLGFFTALPAIWRALQCVRRYYDTRNVFPHLVNCGKYGATIVFYITLSIYRIQRTETHRAIFITFAIINSIYTSIWDVVMDWSLGDPTAPNKFLRKTLGYKKVWTYYVAMTIDPILRFNWILYTFIPLQLQHSAVTSFAVAVSEVLRRGMWTLFRVENEHCTNVGRFRASRDIPLPYDIPTPEAGRSTRVSEDERQQHQRRASQATVLAAEAQRQSTSAADAPLRESLRLQPSHASTFASSAELEEQMQATRTLSSGRRRTASTGAADREAHPSPSILNRMGSILRDAHAQDFERKKKPELGRTGSKKSISHQRRSRRQPDDGAEEDDRDDDDDEEEEEEDGGPSRDDTLSENDGEDEDPRTWEDIREVRREVRIGREGESGEDAVEAEAVNSKAV